MASSAIRRLLFSVASRVCFTSSYWVETNTHTQYKCERVSNDKISFKKRSVNRYTKKINKNTLLVVYMKKCCQHTLQPHPTHENTMLRLLI